jgi:hypothetical protein
MRTGLWASLGLADKNEITLGSVKPLESHSVSGYRVIRVTAEGTADYPNMLSLLSGIEGYDKYICVETLNVSADEEPVDFPGSFAGRGLMPPQMKPEQPKERKTKFTLTIASLAREI